MDYAQDGFAERSGWVAGDDAFLARDINGNATIDGIHELFGSPDVDGFAVLETHDASGDGVIDENDPIFASLRVWQDSNGNGISDAGEVRTLTKAGIASLSVVRIDAPGLSQSHERGNASTFTRTDGTSSAIESNYFEVDARDMISVLEQRFTAPADILKLPRLPGTGNIHSLAFRAVNEQGGPTAFAQLPRMTAPKFPIRLQTKTERLVRNGQQQPYV